MAKTNTTASAANTKKGDKFTPKTTLNSDMQMKHKLKGNTENAQRYIAGRASKRVRDFSRMFSTFRVVAMGVTTNHRLASPLRSMAHYFSIPLSKSDMYEARDKKASVEASVEAAISETESAASN